MEPRPLSLRQTVMWARTALLAAVVACLTACTGGGGVGASAPATSEPTVTTSASTEGAVSTLRGYPMQSVQCPTKPTTEPNQSPEIATGSVRAFLICPLQSGVWGSAFAPYRLTDAAPRGGEPFKELDAAMRLPDIANAGVDQVCPASAQAPRTIFVETAEGLWQAHIPSDACRMYLPQVVDALGKVVIPL